MSGKERQDKGILHASRQAAAFVSGDDVIHKLFTELAYRFKSTFGNERVDWCTNRDRTGGYTRLLQTRIRVGDVAPMAYIE
ncbi:hypothetical protein Scep_024490 [Stephania cephalantha]|uniref:50S ribosomal protein L17 n=1 Tax=Stephania cephalantha TaxID=152367 RepID=A0AAP0EZE4_9MAGN